VLHLEGLDRPEMTGTDDGRAARAAPPGRQCGLLRAPVRVRQDPIPRRLGNSSRSAWSTRSIVGHAEAADAAQACASGVRSALSPPRLRLEVGAGGRPRAGGRGRNENPIAIARACEAILLDAGLAEEAYARYALEANRQGTCLATYRALARKYPHKRPQAILVDLVASTPGEEGKRLAAAKDAGLYAEAIALADRTPCDPRTRARLRRVAT